METKQITLNKIEEILNNNNVMLNEPIDFDVQTKGIGNNETYTGYIYINFDYPGLHGELDVDSLQKFNKELKEYLGPKAHIELHDNGVIIELDLTEDYDIEE